MEECPSRNKQEGFVGEILAKMPLTIIHLRVEGAVILTAFQTVKFGCLSRRHSNDMPALLASPTYQDESRTYGISLFHRARPEDRRHHTDTSVQCGRHYVSPVAVRDRNLATPSPICNAAGTKTSLVEII